MTRNEFNAFVEDQLRARWPKWQPTPALLDDWYSVLRYHSTEVATTAVQDHRLSDKATAFEPKIYEISKLLAHNRSGSDIAQLGSVWVPWVRCLAGPPEHLDWQGREWVRLEYRFSGQANNRRHVSQAAARSAAEIQATYGGQWCGVARPEGQLPEIQPDLQRTEAREWVERHILDGPDGPGRRFLQQHGDVSAAVVAEALAVPTTPPPKHTATRAELDALDKALPPAEHENLTTPEFFAAHPVEEDDPADREPWAA